MAEVTTNLSPGLQAPTVILAPASQFLTIASGPNAGMLTAHKTRMGTNWVGLQGTFGTVSAVSLKYLGDRGEIRGNSPGQLRSLFWMKPGYGLELTVHHDRGLPALRKGDRVSVWIDSETGSPAKVFFHVEEIGSDQGDEDTVTMKITLEHRKGLDDQTSLYRAEVDGNGRVIKFTTDIAVSAASTDPAAGLPTAPAS